METYAEGVDDPELSLFTVTVTVTDDGVKRAGRAQLLLSPTDTSKDGKNSSPVPAHNEATEQPFTLT